MSKPKDFSISFRVIDKDTPIYECFSRKKLEEMRVMKRDLPKLMGIDKWEDTSFDYALPQQWLDKFVERSKLPYDLVLSTTFWIYQPKARWGVPISACQEVDYWLGDRPFARIATID